MFELFGWSWSGHGSITQAGVLLAVSGLLKLGSSGIVKKLCDLAMKIYAAGMSEGSTPLKYPLTTDEKKLLSMLRPLPGKVQRVDLHLGNLPSVGEHLDKQGQVRHFMRSTQATGSQEAFNASVKWIRDHTVKAYQKMKDALDKKYAFYEILSSNTGDFENGLDELADALHTLEDSFAQGHVRRLSGNTNIVKELNYWDEENKKGDPGTGRLGHSEYDNPENDKNREFLEAAKAATGDLILCVLSNLGQSESTFTAALDQLLKTRFQFAP